MNGDQSTVSIEHGEISKVSYDMWHIYTVYWQVWDACDTDRGTCVRDNICIVSFIKSFLYSHTKCTLATYI